MAVEVWFFIIEQTEYSQAHSIHFSNLREANSTRSYLMALYQTYYTVPIRLNLSGFRDEAQREEYCKRFKIYGSMECALRDLKLKRI